MASAFGDLIGRNFSFLLKKLSKITFPQDDLNILNCGTRPTTPTLGKVLKTFAVPNCQWPVKSTSASVMVTNSILFPAKPFKTAFNFPILTV